MKISKIASMFLVGSMTAFMVGCGGGSSSDDSSSNSGTASDAYIKGATVYLDTNDNNIIDANDSKTITDATGNFNFNSNLGIHRIFVIGGTDIATGESLNTPLVLIPEANSSSFNVTPLTTMVTTLMDNNVSRDEAESNVASILGIDKSALYADPVKDENASKATLKLNVVKNLVGTDYSEIAIKMKDVNTSDSNVSFSTIVTTIAQENNNTNISAEAMDSLFTSIDELNVTPENSMHTEAVVVALTKTIEQNNSLASDLNLTSIVNNLVENQSTETIDPSALYETVQVISEKEGISTLNELNSTEVQNISTVVEAAKEANASIEDLDISAAAVNPEDAASDLGIELPVNNVADIADQATSGETPDSSTSSDTESTSDQATSGETPDSSTSSDTESTADQATSGETPDSSTSSDTESTADQATSGETPDSSTSSDTESTADQATSGETPDSSTSSDTESTADQATSGETPF